MTEPRTVTAELTYIARPSHEDRLFRFRHQPGVSATRERNFGYETRQAEVENLRGREDVLGRWSLDEHGFRFFKRATRCERFTSEEEIRGSYYEECEGLMRELTGAKRVVFFDHTVRRRIPGITEDVPGKRQPAAQVHIDQTPGAALARLRRHLDPEEADEVIQQGKRWQIVNLWRPIGHAAYDWPLALCAYGSVDRERDLLPITLKYPDRDGETFGIVFNAKHEWKYMRGMTPEEGVLIKCFDSIQDGTVAAFTPHTAFDDPSMPPDAPPRESIELRALVFYD
ncbi:hypothetical protein PUNSTDRAFT_118676 [Punctularia strigosozonata HHB-11173 SS5]|uniref:uncharacterized protein n=1 Tax=Punctularia strigosozonata (strain HHB-11173) TaxID=741275 RepID=UPI0004417344|nr:uncharacterized protein PUNSTDRAFT_118676 [Punctularia strigosozonata HHB-11173 SS5]EIN11140.1 hypothetical protein PUNSTDRAFT_118676 [Punctularia strigosozonata HHB-11173 SS5]